jgi:hypothetical protein
MRSERGGDKRRKGEAEISGWARKGTNRRLDEASVEIFRIVPVDDSEDKRL